MGRRRVEIADRLFLVGSRQLGVRVPDFNVVFCPQGMSMEEQLAAFRTSEPTVVAGLTESVALLATELQRRKIDTQSEFVDEIPREPSGKRRRIYRTFDLPSV